MLQHAATHCNKVQLSRGSSADVTVAAATTPCNTLQRAATHCNSLQHTATRCNTGRAVEQTLQPSLQQHTATHCNTLQHKQGSNADVMVSLQQHTATQ